MSRQPTTVQEIRRLYDSFSNKDMPWPEFLKEFQGCTDPLKMQIDMADVMAQKHTMQSVGNINLN